MSALLQHIKRDASMKWIEVIQLRSIEGNRKRLGSELNGLINEVGEKSKKQIITAYSRVLIDTDYNIHILHDSNEVEKFGSPLGLQLVNALKVFGLVNHSVWVEMPGKHLIK
jgi:hypothetical protein